MPTATSVFGYHVNNLGPLTTTFTPAPSCATVADYVEIAPVTQPRDIVGFAQCNTVRTWGDCYPSGSVIDALTAKLDIANPEAGYTID